MGFLERIYPFGALGNTLGAAPMDRMQLANVPELHLATRAAMPGLADRREGGYEKQCTYLTDNAQSWTAAS